MKILKQNDPSPFFSLSYSELFYLSIVLALALLLRLPLLNRGLGEDELDTVFYSIETSSIWQTMSNSVSFNNHIGYSLMARFSRAIFGRSEWAFRLPALLFGLGSLYSFWVFSRSFFESRLAVVATSLFALAPAHIIWSISARGYSAMIFCTLLSSYFYLRVLRFHVRRDAFFFIAVTIIGIYVHIYSAFVAMVQVLFLLYIRATLHIKKGGQHAIKASFKILQVAFIIIVGTSFLIYMPVLLNLFNDIIVRGRGDFDPTFPWEVIKYLSGSELPILTLVILLVSICGFMSLRKSHPQEVLYFIGLFLIPVSIMWLSRPFDLYPRFFSYLLPYYLILFLAGVRTIWYATDNFYTRPGYLSHLLAIVITAGTLYNWWTIWPNWVADEGYRDASKAIVADASDSTALCAFGGDAEVFQFYFDRQIIVPESLSDFLKIGGTHPEVRCVYYQASWESPDHTEIAQYLFKHSTWSRIKKMTLFVYQK
jgi:4-amino-4-deoxy-L-arabinose transferase-like glycosyltransferase